MFGKEKVSVWSYMKRFLFTDDRIKTKVYNPTQLSETDNLEKNGKPPISYKHGCLTDNRK